MQDVARVVEDQRTKNPPVAVADGTTRGARPYDATGRQLTKRETNQIKDIYNGP